MSHHALQCLQKMSNVHSIIFAKEYILGESWAGRVDGSTHSLFVCLDYRLNGRDSALSVSEQEMSSNHISRSDVVKMRSRSPNQTLPLR